MLKKNRLCAGISLIVQSISYILLFFMLCRKMKSVAKAFLAVAAIGSVSGMLLLSRREEEAAPVRKKESAAEENIPEDTASLEESEAAVMEPEVILSVDDEAAEPELSSENEPEDEVFEPGFTFESEEPDDKSTNADDEDDIVFDFSLDDEDFAEIEDIKFDSEEEDAKSE